MASNYQLQFILCYNVNYFQAEAKLISRNKFYGDMFKHILCLFTFKVMLLSFVANWIICQTTFKTPKCDTKSN